MATTFKIKDPSQAASAILGGLGIQDSKTDVTNLVGWEAGEGGAGPQFGIANNDDNYNPLNTTLPEQGSASTNSSGVQSYTSWTEGIDATVATLEEPQYAGIISDLENNQDWQTFAKTVDASPWGTHDLGQVSGDPSTPSAAAYTIGSNSTTDNGSQANQVGPSTGKPLSGFAGVLQALDQLYNPAQKSIGWNPLVDITAIPDNVESTAIEILTRATSSLLSIGLIFMGIHLLTSASGAGGGGSNVLEFVNNAQVTSQRAASSEAVQTRHTERLADRAAEREATLSKAKINQRVAYRKARIKEREQGVR